jgi:hypothetical protein
LWYFPLGQVFDAILPQAHHLDVTEPPQDPLSLGQADAARADLYAIHDELDFIKLRLPGCRPEETSLGSRFFPR